ncbi:2-iminoacetate synthase [uncultured Roseburia sp.]|uniref:2-iminoacetate synthase ThiH n=1 Tax=Brotonthovivens ammoniilytica TaxID=2981725 RepID=A0ABT2TPF2_9FIRM|nr:2-iminoacetate synthase ThiH [Brotonthovivens ammoniilytica]MCU6763576.1 2-iminoacetate synthase ThiH [Brotonthovivens ammoniilytica]SCJ25600.1 2-iminoacetate synthase [uncultured Roseburia sp.]
MSENKINESIVTDEIRERMKDKRIDHMTYLPDMQVIDSNIQEKTILAMENYNYNMYTAEDVQRALNKEHISPEDFAALLSPAAESFLEELAVRAQQETRKYFGSNRYMMTPLYLSNYCENFCIYCGFNRHNKIERARLDPEGIERELKAIADTGLEEILLLVGESRSMADIKYLGQAVLLARKYFRVIGLEVYPMNADEYAYLHQCGADYITVFQETYNSDKYETLHLAGHKRIFPYRLNAQERALMGGMRGVTFAALLGLDDFRKDAYATGMHAYYIQQKYPHAEIGFSCPRLRPIVNNDKINPMDVHETQLLQMVCAYRLLMPFAQIVVSSRECIRVRDNLMKICATKVSAGVDTGIGGHTKETKQGDDQFEIDDGRNYEEMYQAITALGLQPVMSDYIYV